MQFSASFHPPVFAPRSGPELQGAVRARLGAQRPSPVYALCRNACGLPELSAALPFGGTILAMITSKPRCFAWRLGVEMDPRLTGSFEEGPDKPSCLARRGFVGGAKANLQHMRLVRCPGLHWAGAVSSLSKVSRPIWGRSHGARS